MNAGSAREERARQALAAVLQLHAAGRHQEALALLAREGLSGTAPGLTVAGGIHLRMGNAREAVRAFDAAARLAPNAAEVHANRGAALLELGRLEDALAALDRSLSLRPHYAIAHFNRGNVLRALRQYEAASGAYAQAYRAEARFADAHLNRGLALSELGRTQEALEEFDQTLRIAPRYAAAHIGRATVYGRMHKLDDAIAALDAADSIEPGGLANRRTRISLLQDAGRYADALAVADDLLRQVPNDFLALRSRAFLLLKLMRLRDGLEAADRAAAVNPQDHEVQVIRAALLSDMGQHQAALDAIETARRLGAPVSALLSVRAVGRALLGDPAEALADFESALALNPDDVHLYYNRAYLRMATGDWEAAWVDFDERLRLQAKQHHAYSQLAPKWQGEPLKGKRLLVYGELGHGDILQFVRFLRLVEDSGVALTIVVRPALVRLFAANFPNADVAPELGHRRDFDFQISLLSLPRVFHTTPATLPPLVPYISALPEKIGRWNARIGPGGVRVGVVWQGDPKYERDGTRSIPLAKFAPLSEVPGVRLFSVQAQVGLDQLDALADKLKITRFGEELERNPDGFQEMAAVIANMDLLIFSDTAPTHLAGAMGRPVWVALPRYADWRWMRDREDSPWYPTMRLFRQETPGDWDGLFRRIAAELRAAVARRH